MKNLIFVDCEAVPPCPGIGYLTEFGAVDYDTRDTFHGVLFETLASLDNPAVSSPSRVRVAESKYVFQNFANWIAAHVKGRAIFVSDNPAFDYQWINYEFHLALGYNPFGHSARRISDFYAGLVGDFGKTQGWKDLRITPHSHQPVEDAMGNVEAFERLLNGERP